MAGYPLGGERFSNVSFVEGKIASVNNVENRKVVFCDTASKPGNSGSPVLDKNSKKVIGLFWGGVNQGTEDTIIPCFTPISEIWDLINKF